MDNPRKRGNGRGLALALGAASVVLAPWLLVVAVYRAVVQTSPWNLIPYPHWDTFDAVTQARALAAAGLGMGRFTLNEVPAFLADSPFGPHGFGYPLALSLGAKLFGAAFPYRAAVLNLSFFSLCLIAYLALTRPGLGRLALLGLTVVSLVDFPHAAATYWQDGTHLGLAVRLAGLFAKALEAGAGRPGRPWRALLFSVIAAAALVKMSWGLLFIPWCLLVLPDTRLGRLAAFPCGAGLLALCYLAYMLPASPFVSYSSPGREVVQNIFRGGVSLAAIPGLAAKLLLPNLQRALELIRDNPFVGVMLAFLPLGLASVLRAASRAREGAGGGRGVRDLAWVHACNLGGYLLAALTYQSLELRHLFPVYLLSFLLVLSLGRSRLLMPFMLGAQLAAALFGFQAVQNQAYALAERPEARLGRIEGFARLSGLFMPSTAQDNAWCNTLLVGNFDTTTEFLGLSPGLGLSYILTYSGYSPPAKSRFLLLKNDWQVAFFASTNRLRFLSRTTAGDLYLNEDCPCQGPAVAAVDGERLSVAVSELEGLAAARALRDRDPGRALAWSGFAGPGGAEVYEATRELTVEGFVQERLAAGQLSEGTARKLRDGLDSLRLTVTFARDGDGRWAAGNARLSVHCRSGLFNSYALPEAALGPDPAAWTAPVSFRYPDLDYFVCDYW
ncbi:hypothetical protein [Solidesulfovibrio sp.]|uniref:hypothetical protein n=1 Tax=Solidesulfovibrio sp. TaxID=2910990 RepID=UPI002B2060B9|nr:hypothetical protein [Solidesulfovibrio sp.]MEA4857609.1 hypothetical protein [Solidesulfovibrio sp.]